MPIPAKCVVSTRNIAIVRTENKKKIILLNKRRQKILVVRVDGCAITTGIRCDYLFIDQRTCEYFVELIVELKGKDIKHACRQLARSIRLLSTSPTTKQKRSLVISSRVPLIATDIQQLKKQFKASFNSLLTIKNNEYTVILV